jgi:Family of unknown function (DUF6092)
MPTAWVLDEDDALELLAYLITAARTQVDEAAEYGPMRLLIAAHRLAETIAPRCSEGTQGLVSGPVQQMPLLAVPRDDRDGYVARLDDLCRAVAEHFTVRYEAGTAQA